MTDTSISLKRKRGYSGRTVANNKSFNEVNKDKKARLMSLHV